MKHKGIICGILAAVCYGTNPFGALPLYEEGVNTASVLFYRFFMAVLMLAIMLIVQRKDFSVTKGELKVLGSLGMLFAASSITYYQSFHLVTSEILSQLPKLPKTGIVNIFTKHTSCGLSINENADPDVRVDMETIFNRLVPENRPEYEHTLEGADDMPAHAKSTLSGVSITIPITDGRLNLGIWQGIYFCEYRNYGGSRELVVTIIGE